MSMYNIIMFTSNRHLLQGRNTGLALISRANKEIEVEASISACMVHIQVCIFQRVGNSSCVTIQMLSNDSIGLKHV